MTKRFSPYVSRAATVLCREGGSSMRAAGTYFEQVPKTVIEKILRQQDPPAENDRGVEQPVEKRGASKTKTRNRKS